jgi:hypothetical protein
MRLPLGGSFPLPDAAGAIAHPDSPPAMNAERCSHLFAPHEQNDFDARIRAPRKLL